MNDLMLVDGGNETVSIAFTGGRERKQEANERFLSSTPQSISKD